MLFIANVTIFAAFFGVLKLFPISKRFCHLENFDLPVQQTQVFIFWQKILELL